MTTNGKTIFGEYRSKVSGEVTYKFKSNNNLTTLDILGSGSVYYCYYGDILYRLDTSSFSVSPNNGDIWGTLFSGSFPLCGTYGNMKRYGNIIALTTGEGLWVSTNRGGSFTKFLSGSFLSVNFSIV
jgi:hypothetical protein